MSQSESMKKAWKDPILREKMTAPHRGKNNPCFGKHPSEATRIKISETEKGKKVSEVTKEKLRQYKGEKHSQFGKPKSETTRKKISEAKKGKTTILKQSRDKISKTLKEFYKVKENHPQWKGGISFYPYCEKFTKSFKERVRAFFGYCCAECGTPQNGYKLDIHHVNFNKMSCCDDSKPLFVPLCRSCHVKTNSKREYWEKHFIDIINQYYDGKCYFTEDEMKKNKGG